MTYRRHRPMSWPDRLPINHGNHTQRDKMTAAMVHENRLCKVVWKTSFGRYFEKLAPHKNVRGGEKQRDIAATAFEAGEPLT